MPAPSCCGTTRSTFESPDIGTEGSSLWVSANCVPLPDCVSLRNCVCSRIYGGRGVSASGNMRVKP
eukprot:6201603-Pleurochrysis_carterae.AAC.3